MAAQHLVKKGIQWNVGNGDSIHVWGDKWLPSPSMFKITSPRKFLHIETRVSELISHDVAAWKTQVIDTIFLPNEAKLIKSIPLSSRLPEDKLVWVATPNGLFTVWSAYRLAMKKSRQAIEVLARILAKLAAFGRCYEDYRYPTRCATSLGELAKAFYQLRRIFRGGESSWICVVMNAWRT